VYEEGRDRIGSALRRMAEDLVKERRQVLELRRENRRLRDELEQLKAAQGKPDPGAASAVRRNP
jgi:phage shock protein A